MVREDIAKLWELRDKKFAIMVVKHPEFDKAEHSFNGKSIQNYLMLNWSSIILFNNEKCKSLTPEYVNTASYYDLHQFKWIEDHTLIGELPGFVESFSGYYPENKEAALVHWTLGAPYKGGKFGESEHTKEWFNLKSQPFIA